ncbi:MAG TPA: type IV secretory system conjugative DNA transfer family protein [Chitinophaga sp.]|uniref:type IV secretory system conjugative DNA transfer family protein n=1 Tax=Chitinophaga sp. TaxID=1869181 RepID=UPI002CBFEAFC|nr:type IV secretory system conjugative DNA transfer family protein [Chitinophaga sp.]HVI44582.1 type IV secretory system conjugative DNA transfer family protein [Chitinophaga sp.]
MLVYDFKMPDLSIIAYNALLKHKSVYKKVPKFCLINFDDLSRSHRCNPLDPSAMVDITDAIESARTILLGLNRSWISKAGDFFVESPINFLTAIIWFLRRYKDGAYCTLPHVIELMMLEYDLLFPILLTEPEITVFVNPFRSAYLNGAYEQLEGQIASTKIGMARLSSPQLYWVMNGADFSLDINNPDDPKVLCLGNNPQKIQVYGAVLSLYVSRLIKVVNQKGKLPSSLIFDEFPTIYVGGSTGIDTLLATARSNLVATTLAVQDAAQIRKDYGKEQADVILNIAGNVISGQVGPDTAKILSERFGKILQEKTSLSINRNDTSISRSTQLDYAIPASTIASLSSGVFVGTVADNPDQKIELKNFHAEIINDHAAIKAEEAGYKPIPKVCTVTPEMVTDNYERIKSEVQQIAVDVMEMIRNTPELSYLLVNQNGG